jgi:hypothetical protein
LVKRERLKALAAVATVMLAGAAPASTDQVARAQGVAKDPIFSTLQDVSAISPDNAWAVGDRRQASVCPTGTVIERWNGKSWTRVSSPDPGSSDSVLDGVSDVARDAAWAVGFYQVGSTARFRTMITAWNGKDWSKVASPDSAEPDNFLFDVASVSRSDAWAVGYDQASFTSRLRTLLLRWNGKTWVQGREPEPRSRQRLPVGRCRPVRAQRVGRRQYVRRAVPWNPRPVRPADPALERPDVDQSAEPGRQRGQQPPGRRDHLRSRCLGDRIFVSRKQ